MWFTNKHDEGNTAENSASSDVIDRLIQELQESEKFTDFLEQNVNDAMKKMSSKANTSNCPENANEQSMPKAKSRKSFKKQDSMELIGHKNLTGVKNSVEKGHLEQDLFSMMMLSQKMSLTWLFGITAFTIQITLGILILLDQAEKDFFATDMSIPIKGTNRLHMAQALAVLLSIMTQTDLLMGLRTILLLPRKDEQKWQNLLQKQHRQQKRNCNLEEQDEFECDTWWVQIFLPNALKMLQGALVLAASFVVIIQSETTVDVLKDYSALFVVSSVDDLFYNMAEMGYFGSSLSIITNDVKMVEVETNEDEIRPHLTKFFPLIMICFLIAWINVTVGQANGKYLKQAYPLCPLETMFNHEQKFINIIGDRNCQFSRGEGTNIVECGWDGGDCVVLNQRYPLCTVHDFYLLGDGICHGSAYNNKVCGFDNGDCIHINIETQERYLNCSVENIGWVGDGICNGGNYASIACENDGGDCTDCVVDDVTLIGDGKCDGGNYNTNACSFDGGDCIKDNTRLQEKYPNCSVPNPWQIGDGVCNGREYASPECEMDGGDCVDCIVDDVMLIGDGFCNGGPYMTKECSLDGGDCNDCIVPFPVWVGDGVCNGGEYDTEGCSFDAGDCSGTDGNIHDNNKCIVPNTAWIGDGICDGGPYLTRECNFDGGDCNDCIIEDKNRLGNGICDDRYFNTESCGFDGGDCLDLNDAIQRRKPDCEVPNIGWVGDGTCDGGKYASEECGNDGGDCANCFVDDMMLIGNGFCDEGEYNVEECSFDGNDCYPKLKLIGDDYGAAAMKWNGFALGPDGAIYGMPFNTNRMLKVDPSTNSTELVGDDLGNIEGKYWGSIVGMDGIIYGVPRQANAIVSYNVTSKESILIAEGHPILETEKTFSGCALVNGTIYFLPFNYNKIVKFDPSNLNNPLTDMGGDLGHEKQKIVGGTIGKDGNIYGVPFDGKRVIKFDVANRNSSFMGDEYEGVRKWNDAVLAKDGNIYACPSNFNRILQINTKSQTTNLVGPDLSDDSAKWSKFVEGTDGFLYGIPFSSNTLLRFDPILHKATIIPLEEDHHGEFKWYGGVLAKNGFIYTLPFSANRVLSIAPLSSYS